MRILFILVMILVMSCTSNNNNNLTIKDILIFKNTPSWNLIQAIQRNRISDIKEIIESDTMLKDYQEPVFGMSPLMWAVQNDKYQSVKALLEMGADPNLRSKTGATALFKAISYSWVDTDSKSSRKYVELLLDYNADPNIVYIGQNKEGVDDPIEEGTSPLMHAVPRGFGKVKALVEAGAKINYKTKTNKNAAIIALLMEEVNVAHYLIVENNAIVSEPYYFYEIGGDSIEYDKPHYPVLLLRNWIFDLDSEKYQKKLDIIKEFRKQGYNYWGTEIHPKTKERIKIIYPQNWEEYLNKY